MASGTSPLPSGRISAAKSRGNSHLDYLLAILLHGSHSWRFTLVVRVLRATRGNLRSKFPYFGQLVAIYARSSRTLGNSRRFTLEVPVLRATRGDLRSKFPYFEQLVAIYARSSHTSSNS